MEKMYNFDYFLHLFLLRIFQVEIQVLHMSQDAKDLVHKTLTDLRGSSYKISDESKYKDTGQG